MMLFVEVVTRITMPIVLLIGFGFVLKRLVAVDVTTLNRLVIYATLPALLLISLAEANLPRAEVAALGVMTLAQFAVLLAIGWAAAAALRLPRAWWPVIALAAAFANTGNYGIPLIELAFGPALVPHQAIITTILTVLILTLGPLMLAAGRTSLRASLATAFRTPLLPAVGIGLALNALAIPIPDLLRYPLSLVGGANTPAALIALGAHLGMGGSLLAARGPVALAIGLRLVVGPFATFLLLLAIAVPAPLDDLFLVGAAAPVGVLLPIFCMEYGRDARGASAIVALSTALSPIAVTLVVLLVRLS